MSVPVRGTARYRIGLAATHTDNLSDYVRFVAPEIPLRFAQKGALRPAVCGRKNTTMNVIRTAYIRDEGATCWGLDREASGAAEYGAGLSRCWPSGVHSPGSIAVPYHRLTRATSTLCPSGGKDLSETMVLAGVKRSRLAMHRSLCFWRKSCSSQVSEAVGRLR